ncbi:MAG: hypothetical protein AAF604_24495 [Acidobacteriota bacterium]
MCLGLIVAFAFAGLAQSPPANTDWEVIDERSGAGEQCLVCGQPIHGDEILELRYQGRTFYVAAKMLEELEASPRLYLSRIEAHSALFDEASPAHARPSRVWMWGGLYLFVGLLCAALCGVLAVSRGLAPIPWFFAGLLGNVAALAVLSVTPRRTAPDLEGWTKAPLTRAPRSCPACSADNHPAAQTCLSCGVALHPTIASEADLV